MFHICVQESSSEHSGLTEGPVWSGPVGPALPCMPVGPKPWRVRKMAWSWCSAWSGSPFCCTNAQRQTFSRLRDGFPLSMRLMDWQTGKGEKCSFHFLSGSSTTWWVHFQRGHKVTTETKLCPESTGKYAPVWIILLYLCLIWRHMKCEYLI